MLSQNLEVMPLRKLYCDKVTHPLCTRRAMHDGTAGIVPSAAMEPVVLVIGE